jgi:hypothetical protein
VWRRLYLAKRRAVALAMFLLVASNAANACCIGIYYALDENTAQSLRSLSTADLATRINSLLDTVKGADKLDVDESWDAMHRVLTNGTLKKWPGEHPTSYVVLGGESLFERDDWIVVLISATQAQAASAAIRAISQPEFRRRYFRIDPDSYDVPLSEDDFAYTWRNFEDVRGAFARWARQGKWILFVAAQ